MRARDLLFAGIILGLILAGCGKKKTDAAKEAAFAEATGTESDEATSDSGDIFDEFYSDDEASTLSKDTEAAEDSFEPPSSTPEFSPDGRYVVQVSCVASKSLAESVSGKVEARGYPAYVAEVENPTGELIGMYYRVRISGFNYVSAARRFGDDYLVPDGYDFWVDNRSNDNVGLGGYGLGEKEPAGYESSYAAEPQPASSDADWGAQAEPEPVTEPVTPEPATEPADEPEPPPTPPSPEPAPAQSNDDWGAGSGDDRGSDSGDVGGGDDWGGTGSNEDW